MTPARDDDTVRFEALSRAAATGAIAPADQAWLDAYLRAHPERLADAEWDAVFAAQVAQRVEVLPALPGWTRTEAALRADRLARATARPGLLDRLADWLGGRLGVRLDLQAIAATLVVAQAAVIGVGAWQWRDAPTDAIRSGPTATAPAGGMLRVSFRADIRESELRDVLAAIGGEIVAGPGQLGLYHVRVREGDAAAATERLRASGLTVLVEVLEPRP